jgi:hypothetical protein
MSNTAPSSCISICIPKYNSFALISDCTIPKHFVRCSFKCSASFVSTSTIISSTYRRRIYILPHTIFLNTHLLVLLHSYLSSSRNKPIAYFNIFGWFSIHWHLHKCSFNANLDDNPLGFATCNFQCHENRMHTHGW